MTSKPTDEKTPSGRPARQKLPVSSKQIQRGEQYDDIVEAAKELFLEKNEQYGDAISRTGLLGAVVEIAGISARLEKLVLGASDAGKSEEEA
ncbi:MAG: hypothetical protein ACYSW3_30355, partial [Planctomycetota bacterium]